MMNDDPITVHEIAAQLDQLPYGQRARVIVDRLVESWRQGASGTELGDLYVAMVSAMFPGLPTGKWPAVHHRLTAELKQEADFPESDIWEAINSRYV